jgi:predicted deacylase
MTDHAAPKIELSPPDLSVYAEGTGGFPYALSFKASEPGPHVLLNAVVHGNELCGAIALDDLLREGLRPRRGTLTFCFANVEAFHSFDPKRPEASRFVDEDFNRLWDLSTLDGPRQSKELTRARQLRPLYETVDFLLDIHSMQNPTAALGLCGPTAKGAAMARALDYPAYVVADAGHAAGRRLRDFTDFSDEASPKNALLVECGQHWEAISAGVAMTTTARFLGLHGVVDDAFVAKHSPVPMEGNQKVIEITHAITVKTEKFRFADSFKGMEVIAKQGSPLGWDDEAALTTPYDECVLIMPSRRLLKGQTAVRLGRFVH